MCNKKLVVKPYSGDEEEWDKFINDESMNGTFLQTRKFINYHTEGKFKDASVCVYKGNELVATVLACEIYEDSKKIFFAHKGSTFGGITISEKIYTATLIDELLNDLDEYFVANSYDEVYFKMVPYVYQKKNTDLIDYFLYKYGYRCYDELNYFMHLDRYKEDVISQFSSSKRRDYKYSLKNSLDYRELTTKEQIKDYYEVLQKNLRKLELPSVHTLEDLYDLKFNRFDDRIKFYGVYHEGKIIAGTMLFFFDNNVLHTQYLSSDEDYLKLYPMDFLIKNIIQLAVDMDMRIFTFGICTEDQGRYLNLGLSRFKEGFGTEFCINRSYEKKLK